MVKHVLELHKKNLSVLEKKKRKAESRRKATAVRRSEGGKGVLSGTVTGHVPNSIGNVRTSLCIQIEQSTNNCLILLGIDCLLLTELDELTAALSEEGNGTKVCRLHKRSMV